MNSSFSRGTTNSALRVCATIPCSSTGNFFQNSKSPSEFRPASTRKNHTINTKATLMTLTSNFYTTVRTPAAPSSATFLKNLSSVKRLVPTTTTNSTVPKYPRSTTWPFVAIPSTAMPQMPNSNLQIPQPLSFRQKLKRFWDGTLMQSPPPTTSG